MELEMKMDSSRSPMSLRSHFKFFPIDSSRGQIRLLKIAPGENAERIECTYRIVSVYDYDDDDDDKNDDNDNDNNDDNDNDGGSGIAYNTISYAWGSGAQDSSAILVEGTRVAIVRSLLAALRRIRDAREARYLWVDQLCIDQADEAEKAAQVNMMHAIYARCARCYLWMGDVEAGGWGLRDEAEALTAARGVLVGIAMMAGEAADRDLPFYLRGKWQFKVGKAFAGLMRAAWWTRIWTVQEAISPRNAVLLWGPLEIAWKTVTTAARNMVREGEETGEIDSRKHRFHFGDFGLEFFEAPVMGLIFASGWKEKPDPSLYMLWRFRYRDSSDPRDKVYVILNLVKEGSLPLPSVRGSDYVVETRKLYRDVMLDLLRGEMGLQSLIGRRGEIGEIEMPSWVVDWSLPKKEKRIAKFWPHCPFWRMCCADEGLGEIDREGFVREEEFGEDVLNLKGVFFDRVLVRSEVVSEEVAARAAAFWDETHGDDDDDDETEEEERGEGEEGSEGEKENESEKKETEDDDEPEDGHTTTGTEERQDETESLSTSSSSSSSSPSPSSISSDDGTDELHTMATDLIAEAITKEPRHTVISEIYWKGALSGLIEGYYTDDGETMEGLPADAYWRTEMLANQRLFITENGAVGLGPSNTSVGDEVWILAGGSMPFLLGPLREGDVGAREGAREGARAGEGEGDGDGDGDEDGDGVKKGKEVEGHYTFRGDVFIPGIMYGEAVKSRVENLRTVHIH